MSRPVGALALAVARRVLDRDDVRRVVAPTIADLRFEHHERIEAGDAAGARRVRIAGLLSLARLVAQLHVRRRARRLTGSSPSLLVASTAASLVATPALSAEARILGTSQLVHVAVGVVVATLLSTTAPRTLRRAGPYALAMVLVPLAIVAGGGEIHEGARRWLDVGPLHVHVAALVAPAWVLAASALATSPRRLIPACGAVLGLLVATRDLGAVLLHGAIAVAALPGRAHRLRSALGVMVALAAGVAALRQPAIAPVRHVEGILRLASAQGGPAAVIASAALAATVIGAGAVALRVAGGFPARAARAIAAYLLLASLGGLLVDGAVPFVSYGGSGVVSGMAMIGILGALRGAHSVLRPPVSAV